MPILRHDSTKTDAMPLIPHMGLQCCSLILQHCSLQPPSHNLCLGTMHISNSNHFKKAHKNATKCTLTADSRSKFFAKDIRNLLKPIVQDVWVLGAGAALVNDQGVDAAVVEVLEGRALATVGTAQRSISSGVAAGVSKVALIFRLIWAWQTSEHAV